MSRKAPQTVRDGSADGVDRADVRAVADAPGAILGRWTLVIDGWLPPSLNVLLRMHWARRRRTKNDVYLVIGYRGLAAGIPPATGRRRVSLVLTVANRSHAMDPDNALKVLMDALVRAKLLVDDRAEFCELGRVEIVKGARKRTEITLEDL
jgi:hypothetical protein